MGTDIQTSENQAIPDALRKLRPTYMEEEFKDFSSRVLKRVDERPPRPDPDANAELKSGTPELEHWNKTGEVKPKQAKEPESNEDSSSGSSEGNGGPEKSAEVKESDEPRPDERIWNKSLEGKELENHHKRVETQAKTSLEHIASHAKVREIQAGLHNLFKGRDAQFNDFVGALSEVKNPGEVLAHIGLSKQDRDILLGLPTWQAVRKAVHQISGALLPKPAPKPRAPKPPSEVGGRGTAPTDESADAVRNGDYRAFEAAENRRYFRK